MWSTYPVGTRKAAGTGIAVFMSDRGTAVVTSAHVLETARQGPVFIAVRMAGTEGGTRTAIVGYYPPRAGGSYYVRHPRHDVAAFALPLPEGPVSMNTCLDYKGIGNQPLHAGDQVFFAGYPDVMPYLKGVFPVLRKGTIATYPVGTPEMNDMFCIDAGVYPGDSGSPVFTASGGSRRPRLAGMILKRVTRDPHDNSNIAVAVSAGAIRETLDMLAAKAPSNAGESRGASGRPAAGYRAVSPPRSTPDR
ncbi:MAG TPA: serine protease [Verrucomicrobiales bacterium]|nr:serine protease [Verrucomicrobiales bacterium]